VNLAPRLFEAQTRLCLIEDELGNLLVDHLGDGWDDYTFDATDDSIEVFGVASPSAAAFDALREAGFARIWQHPHKQNEPANHLCGCKAVRP
jgi:hypothetical protein